MAQWLRLPDGSQLGISMMHVKAIYAIYAISRQSYESYCDELSRRPKKGPFWSLSLDLVDQVPCPRELDHEFTTPRVLDGGPLAHQSTAVDHAL